MRSGTTIIELNERSTVELDKEQLTRDEGELLWRLYGNKVSVEFPSPVTNNYWRLTAADWVGHIPLTPELHLSLMPKVEIRNLFRMLEYAWSLKSFHLLEGLVECESFEEFYERLANMLSLRILSRARQGFCRTYEPRQDQLSYVRGRIDIRSLAAAPWACRLNCHYHEHSADIEDNQLLAWTMMTIARSGICTDRALHNVRRAFRSLAGFVSMTEFESKACTGRLYNRLNEDYAVMHALCRFFLENTGPQHRVGDSVMLPYLGLR